MKVHPVNLLAAFVMSALITYGLSIMDSNVIKVAMGIGSFVFFASTLGVSIGITFTSARTGVNVKVVSMVFFVIALIMNLAWAYFTFSQASYVITVGIAFLLYVVVANAIYRAQT